MKLAHVRKAWLRKYKRTKNPKDHPKVVMYEIDKFGGHLLSARWQWTPRKEERVEKKYEKGRITYSRSQKDKGVR